LSEGDKFSLNTRNRRTLRKVYGPLTEQGSWGTRTEQELGELFKAYDLVADIKRGRLEWLEHVIGMDQTRIVKTIFESNVQTRPGEHPASYLMDIGGSFPGSKAAAA
jgi:hypothetical protein